MVWTGSGEHVLLGSEVGELHVWESLTLKEVSRVKGHSGWHLHGINQCRIVCGVCLNQNSYFVAAAIVSVDLSPDGGTVVTGSKDKCVGVWHFS